MPQCARLNTPPHVPGDAPLLPRSYDRGVFFCLVHRIREQHIEMCIRQRAKRLTGRRRVVVNGKRHHSFILAYIERWRGIFRRRERSIVNGIRRAEEVLMEIRYSQSNNADAQDNT